MMPQNNRKAYDDLLIRSDAFNRKDAANEQGKILPDEEKDADQAKFNELLKRAQRSSDEMRLKAR
jgi:hypothetical protein